MANYTTTIPVTTSPEATFDDLADFTNAKEWDPGIVEAKRLDDGPIGVGSRFAVTVAFYGKRIVLEYRIDEYDRPRRLVLRADNKKVRSVDVITVSPRAEGGADLTYDATITLRGPMKLLDKGLALAFKNIGDKAAAGLRARFNP